MSSNDMNNNRSLPCNSLLLDEVVVATKWVPEESVYVQDPARNKNSRETIKVPIVAGFCFHADKWLQAVSVTLQSGQPSMIPGSAVDFPVVAMEDRELKGFLLAHATMSPDIERYLRWMHVKGLVIVMPPGGSRITLDTRRVVGIIQLVELPCRQVTAANAMQYANKLLDKVIPRPWHPALGGALIGLRRGFSA